MNDEESIDQQDNLDDNKHNGDDYERPNCNISVMFIAFINFALIIDGLR